MDVKLIEGIWIVDKHYDLIWLRNDEKKLSQTLNYFKFETILFQSFDGNQVKKIMEALNCEEKLLIDFDKSKVKKIELKNEPFVNHMKNFMNANAAEMEISTIDTESKYYNF